MKNAFVASLLLAAAACGPRSSTTANGSPLDNTGGEVAAGPVYAGLFVEGARWTFDVHTLDDSVSDTAPNGFETTVDDFQASCFVESLTTFGDITISDVACDDAWPTGDNPLRGVWAMDPRGLWAFDDESVDEFGGDAPVLEGEPMIASPPAAWRVEEHDDAGELVGVTELAHEDGAWCWNVRHTQGDSSWDTLCFDGGPARGDHGWSGAEEHSYTFERVD